MNRATTTGRLAIDGGAPIRLDGWPKWPQHTQTTARAVQSVLDSGRWAISGPSAGQPLAERAFATEFATFCGCTHCVPTDHGSSALSIALEALDIGAGDEVIVPALTWVATASVVVNVNAVPVVVDVDDKTLSMAPGRVEEAITERTKAIMPVHLYCGMADMDSLCEISRRRGLPIIEDCAHVHGAEWNGRPAGSLGSMGCFSMQQSKVLTAGEGGAVVTDDDTLAGRLEELRSDSRVYTDGALAIHDMELVDGGSVQGTNYCLSEFQSAILLDQLPALGEQNDRRARNAQHLDELLSGIMGVTPIGCYPKVTARTYYCYVVRYDKREFADGSIDVVCRALKAELGVPFFPVYDVLHRVYSLAPASKRRNHLSAEHLARLDLSDVSCPVAESARESCICIPHWVLLGTSKDMEDIAAGFDKVRILASDIGASE